MLKKIWYKKCRHRIKLKLSLNTLKCISNKVNQYDNEENAYRNSKGIDDFNINTSQLF